MYYTRFALNAPVFYLDDDGRCCRATVTGITITRNADNTGNEIEYKVRGFDGPDFIDERQCHPSADAAFRSVAGAVEEAA